MSEEIIKVLDALAERFGLVVNWTSTNIIPYLEQLCGKYVNYEMTTSIIWLLFGIVCLILGVFSFKKMKYLWVKYQKATYGDDEDGYMVGSIFLAICFGVLVIVGLIVVMTQLFDIATCIVFPEKIIIEELKKIYNSVS